MSDSALLSLIRRRGSCRRYDPGRPVPEDLVVSMAEAARLAPSACNSQPWRLIAVRDPGIRERICREGLSGVVANRFASDAPLLFILCADMSLHYARMGEAVKGIDYHQMDCGIAGEHLVLRAEELGLGTCWIGWFRQRSIRKILGIPSRVKILALISVGYPLNKAEPREKKRRPLQQTLFAEGWGREFPAEAPRGASGT
jgi:nitroreductase